MLMNTINLKDILYFYGFFMVHLYGLDSKQAHEHNRTVGPAISNQNVNSNPTILHSFIRLQKVAMTCASMTYYEIEYF